MQSVVEETGKSGDGPAAIASHDLIHRERSILAQSSLLRDSFDAGRKYSIHQVVIILSFYRQTASTSGWDFSLCSLEQVVSCPVLSMALRVASQAISSDRPMTMEITDEAMCR